MRETYRTVSTESRYEPDKIKGSRFIATVAPAGSVHAAGALVERVRLEFPDSRHTCFAWRLGPAGEEFRSSDDGEPSGSAGRPIHMQIEGHDVTDAVVVVTRWFGGTKLGVGGLVRAYGGAAGQALDRADIVTVEVKRRLLLEHPYDSSGPVQGLLAAHGIEPRKSEYGADVRLEVEVAIARAESFLDAYRDRTAGRGRVRDVL